MCRNQGIYCRWGIQKWQSNNLTEPLNITSTFGGKDNKISRFNENEGLGNIVGNNGTSNVENH